MSTTTTTSTIGEHGAVFVFVNMVQCLCLCSCTWCSDCVCVSEHGAVFVSQNILHLTSRATAEGADEQVTTSGIDGQVYNGIPDWVSESLNWVFRSE